MTGRTCAGTLVTGTGKDGAPRATYLHHVADNEETMRRDGCQAVVWQTAINPVIAMELLAHGAWSGAGVLGPEALPAAPFLELLADHGSPHGVDERDPAAPLVRRGEPRPARRTRRLASCPPPPSSRPGSTAAA
jgi:saccharopine dehydrogenase (NAD+, L-lysine forming)